MEFEKDNILYTPTETTNVYYLSKNPIPTACYRTDDGALHMLVPNRETYINGKPWYEVKSVSGRKKCKEVDKSPYWYWHIPYEVEDRWFCDKTLPYLPRDKDSIYKYLCSGDLVLKERKNCYPHTNNTMKKDGNEYIMTTEFNSHDNDYLKNEEPLTYIRYDSECFQTWEECQKYIVFKRFSLECVNNKSEHDYSLQEACVYLKRKGYAPECRKQYLKAFDKVLQDNPINEVSVRDGKVWYGCKSEQPDVEYPEKPENINRSMKALREYNEQCSYITNCINWYNHHKELVLNND